MGQLGHGPADRALRQIHVAFEHGQDMLDLDVARLKNKAIQAVSQYKFLYYY